MAKKIAGKVTGFESIKVTILKGKKQSEVEVPMFKDIGEPATLAKAKKVLSDRNAAVEPSVDKEGELKLNKAGEQTFAHESLFLFDTIDADDEVTSTTGIIARGSMMANKAFMQTLSARPTKMKKSGKLLTTSDVINNMSPERLEELKAALADLD